MVTCNECMKELADRKGLSCHVKVTHKLQFIDYVIKHEHGGHRPICRCGCGNEVSFFCGKFMTWVNGHAPQNGPKTTKTREKIAKTLTGRRQSSQSNAKRSQATKAYHEQHPEFAERTSVRMRNRTVTSETRRKVSHTRTVKIANGDITINRDKVSETITKRYLDGGFAWARGRYVSSKTKQTHTYRSSWELMLMKLLDADSDVLTWEAEFTVIPYALDGKSRRYIPDFHVVRRSCEQLVEVKPTPLRGTAMNVAKRQAAQAYCTARGWCYIEWEPRDVNVVRERSPTVV